MRLKIFCENFGSIKLEKLREKWKNKKKERLFSRFILNILHVVFRRGNLLEYLWKMPDGKIERFQKKNFKWHDAHIFRAMLEIEFKKLCF